jgi:hypothetical protein
MRKKMSASRVDTLARCDVDYFQLPVVECFGNGGFHTYTALKGLNLPKLRDELADSLIRSEVRREQTASGKEWECTHRMLLRLAEKVFCYIEPLELTVYAQTPDLAMEHADRLLVRYGEPKRRERPSFFLLSTQASGIDLKRVPITQPFVLSDKDLALHYGGDIVEFERHLIKAFNSRQAGASVLRGEPGTGKTSFIRHLVAKLRESHRFYYLPIHAYGCLTAPEMVEFWLRQSRLTPESKKVVVLEDAEDLLMERGADNQAKVSNLLNIADGLLGEFLRVHVICTVNIPLDRLDPAIMRPGRLVAFREFKRLSREQACWLAEAKGRTLAGEQASYSLAEIYTPAQRIGDVFSRRRIGFAA